MKLKGLRKRYHFVANGKRYMVRVTENSDFDLAFKTRDLARIYKWSLKNSMREFSATIHLVRFNDGFQIEDREVS